MLLRGGFALLGRAPVLCSIVLSIAEGNGYGDIGTREESGVRMTLENPGPDWRAIYAFLELYRATGRSAYLDAPGSIGTQVLERRDGDRFVDGATGLVRLDAYEPLAV